MQECFGFEFDSSNWMILADSGLERANHEAGGAEVGGASSGSQNWAVGVDKDVLLVLVLWMIAHELSLVKGDSLFRMLGLRWYWQWLLSAESIALLLLRVGRHLQMEGWSLYYGHFVVSNANLLGLTQIKVVVAQPKNKKGSGNRSMILAKVLDKLKVKTRPQTG